MFIGVHEQYQGSDATTPEQTKLRYPRVQITREFKGGVIKPQNLVKSALHLCKPVWDAGIIANVSFKLSKPEVFDGSWRIYVEELCRFLVDNMLTGRTILTFWHEPEDDADSSFPNGKKSGKVTHFKDGAEFVRYFNTLNDWCKGVSSNIVTSHAALGYGYRPSVGGPNDKSAWVSDPAAWVTSADIHAIDIYSGRSFSLTDILPNMSAFKRWRDAHPGAWGVAERGWTTNPMNSALRADAITQELVWLAETPDQPTFYIVWLTEGTENDQGLKPDAGMTAALNHGFDIINAPAPEPEPDPQPTDQECPLCHGKGRVPVGTYTITTTVQAVR